MKTFYRTDANGAITAWSDACFLFDAEGNCLCRETEKTIVQGPDGAAYFEGEVPESLAGLLVQQRRAVFEAAVSARFQKFLQERGWDSLGNVLAQTGVFAADAATAQAAYDALWQAAFALVPLVETGELTADGAMARLPELAWPHISTQTGESAQGEPRQ